MDKILTSIYSSTKRMSFLSDRYYLAFLLSISFILPLNAQVFALKEKALYALAYPTALSQPHDGLMRAVVFGVDSGCCPAFKVLVFNSNFQLVDSVQILKGFRPDNNEPIRVNDRLYWASIYHPDTTTMLPNKTAIFSVLELDTMYHYINHHNFATPSGTVGTTTTLGMAKIKSSYYAAYWLRSLNKTIIYKLNNSFVKTDSLVCNSLLNDIKAFGNNLLVSFPAESYSACKSKVQPLPGSFMKTVIFDTLFNQVSCRIFDSLGMFTPVNVSNFIGITNAYAYTAKVVPVSKSKYLALGSNRTSYHLGANFVPHVAYNFIMDRNHTTLQTSIYGGASHNTNYFDYSNYVAVQENEIISVGTIGYDFQQIGPAQTQSTKIFIRKIDTMGTTLLYKEYSDGKFYRTNSIVFTTDGGYLISGIRYDSAVFSSPIRYQSFLLKLDRYGNSNGLGILESNGSLSTIKCFPNPANTTLQFDLPLQEHFTIEIMDASGRLLFQKVYYSNGETIDISQLKEQLCFIELKPSTIALRAKFSSPDNASSPIQPDLH
jgi:hypothetical protein